VGDALPPGRPAPVDRRRARRHRPVVGPAALVVRPPDARPVVAAELQPPGLLGAERIVGAGPIVAGALRPDGEGQARVPLHPSQLKTTRISHKVIHRPLVSIASDLLVMPWCDNNTLEMVRVRRMLLIWFCLFFMATRVAVRGIGGVDEDVWKKERP
jgi:hypothetical protein